MNARVDVLVAGGGPGGLVAAASAAEAGKRVCLVDDNPAGGGQIWRSGITGPNPHAAALVRRLEAANGEARWGWRAVAAPMERVLRIENFGEFCDIQFDSLILATGARERFLPFPGWTLPGVYGAGGLQAFVKSGLDIRGKRVVVAGTGPLLLAVAAHLRAAGARILTVVEQAPLRRLARFSLQLLRGQMGKLIEGAGYAFNTAGIPYRTGAWVTGALGRDHLEKVTLRVGSRIMEIACDRLAIGFHLVPNTELPQLLGCELDGATVRVDEFQQTSVPGIYCIGEPTGIGGLDKAMVEGRIAGLAAAGQEESAKPMMGDRSRHIRFAREMAVAFALREELRTLATGSTPVCRCEDVSYDALAQCHSWRAAKLHTRCGMGPCQGRICGPATEFLFGWKPAAARPPIFPVDVDVLAHPAEEPAVASAD